MSAKAVKPVKSVLLRTPVVAVMGHVDHGKTTLLDAIRGTSVTATEAGGITQNTRAHQIVFKGHKITFIDTPGHEAFSNMRSRGAKVTDIVLLVVAADDGVQPQTKESIKFAQQQKVPIIVALNKIDVPGKNINKLKQELTTAGLLLEEYGGDVMLVEVSALKKIGIDNLLERLLLIAEMNELKFEKPQNVHGRLFILESNLDNRRGPVALGIVKAGKIGALDYLVHGPVHTRLRSLLDSEQRPIVEAEQGDPVWIVGLDSVFKTGEMIDFVETEKEAHELAQKYEQAEKVALAPEADAGEISDLDLLASLVGAQQKEAEIKYINIVLKTDVEGTLEAVKEQLMALNDEAVQIKIMREGTGQITEEDVLTAKSSKGLVIGFQVSMDKHVTEVAKKEKVIVRNYDIIYTLIDELAGAMDGLLEPVEQEVEIARAHVKKVFKLSNGMYVGGSEIIKGTLVRGSKVYIQRGEERVGTGKVTLLKVLKDEVKEVKKGIDCGIMIEPNLELQEGDEIVSFRIDKV